LKRRVCVVVTARPSYSRIKTALEAIKGHPDLELQLVIAASALLERYGSAVDDIRKDGFDVAATVYTVLEGENPTSMAKSTGLGLLEMATVLDNLKPDVVVTIADRYETIATAIAAAYMNIPVAHVQGGEVTGSIDDRVRHAVTKLADFHLVANQPAAERVVRMGEDPATVFVTGCPSIDLAARVLHSPGLDFDPFQRYRGVGVPLELSQGYIVAMQHPVTTEYEDARRQVTETLHATKAVGLPTLWFWPNVDAGADGTSKGIRAFRELESPQNMHFFRHIESFDFLKLVYGSKAIVGNSSVGIRECSFLGVPAVNIGTRQTGRERGANVTDVGHSRQQIAQAIVSCAESARPPQSNLYGDGRAGERIADLLSSVSLATANSLRDRSAG